MVLKSKAKNKLYNKERVGFYDRLEDLIDQKAQRNHLYSSLNVSFEGERLF
jgi:hypothetical protein